jgi:hypothetical protein
MGCRLAVTLATVTSFTLANCTGGPPTAVPTSGEGSVQPMDTPTQPAISLPTDTPVPPTVTSTPEPTATATPTTTPLPPTSTPRPATHPVCGSGCDFTTIQTAIDAPDTTSGAVIEVRDPVHTEAAIVVSKDVTIRGLGMDDTVVQAHETLKEAPDRVFLVEKGVTVILQGLTIQHGRPSDPEGRGGGVMNFGTLTLINCRVTENIANGGGGICNSGALTLIDSAVSYNTAAEVKPPGIGCGGGGGIKSGGESLRLINSTVNNNQAGIGDRGWGGGVHVGCNCTAVFTNTTISSNSAVVDGGAVRVRGTLKLVNCTIYGNDAGKGGGLYVVGKLDYLNTIVASNGHGNCVLDSSYGFTFQGEGSLGLNSNNLVSSGSCESEYSGDPLLGPLGDNGGATLTHALLPGSPAIDAIPGVSCTLPTDQRGGLRPIVQMSPETPCDIGAFEVQAGQ